MDARFADSMKSHSSSRLFRGIGLGFFWQVIKLPETLEDHRQQHELNRNQSCLVFLVCLLSQPRLVRIASRSYCTTILEPAIQALPCSML
jgi:hypothetical protein